MIRRFHTLWIWACVCLPVPVFAASTAPTKQHHIPNRRARTEACRAYFAKAKQPDSPTHLFQRVSLDALMETIRQPESLSSLPNPTNRSPIAWVSSRDSEASQKFLQSLEYAKDRQWSVAKVMGFQKGVPAAIYVAMLSSQLPVEVRTAQAFDVMRKHAKKDGVVLSIASGFRNHKQQEEAYRDYCYHRGVLAGQPGFSRHQAGLALDLHVSDRTVYRWLTKHAAAYGFYRTVRGERWHWEYTPGVLVAVAT